MRITRRVELSSFRVLVQSMRRSLRCLLQHRRQVIVFSCVISTSLRPRLCVASFNRVPTCLPKLLWGLNYIKAQPVEYSVWYVALCSGRGDLPTYEDEGFSFFRNVWRC